MECDFSDENVEMNGDLYREIYNGDRNQRSIRSWVSKRIDGPF